MSITQRVAKNTLFLLAAQPFQRALSFASVVLLLRHLSVTEYGVFGFADALVGIVGVFVNFGTGTYLVREIAKNKDRAPELIGDAMVMQAATFAAVAAALYGWCLFRGYPPQTTTVIMLVMAGVLFADWTDSIESAFEGYQRMEFPAVLSVAGHVLVLLAVLTLRWMDWGVVGLAALYLGVDAISLLASAYLVRRTITSIRIRPALSRVWAMLRAGAPFLAISALWMLAFHVDKVMIHEMMDDEAVGYYNAAYRLFEVLIALPLLLGQALYPAFSEQVGLKDLDGLRTLYARTARAFFAVGVPICVGVAMAGPLFLPLLFGDKYAPAGSTLAIFGGILWLWFFSTTGGWMLTALNRLRLVFLANVGSLAVNVGANLVLIPRIGYDGAAIATGLSEVVLVVVYFVATQRRLGLHRLSMVPIRPLVAGAVMGAALWAVMRWTEAEAPAVRASSSVVAAGVVYAGTLVAIGGIGEPEKALLRKVFGRFSRSGS